jgi:hypothetical protein
MLEGRSSGRTRVLDSRQNTRVDSRRLDFEDAFPREVVCSAFSRPGSAQFLGPMLGRSQICSKG